MAIEALEERDLLSISAEVLPSGTDVVFHGDDEADLTQLQISFDGTVIHNLGGRFGFESGTDLDSVSPGIQSRTIDELTSLSYVDVAATSGSIRNDLVRFSGVSDFASVDLTVLAGDIQLNSNAVVASGSGHIELTADGLIDLQTGSSLTTVDGGLTLIAHGADAPRTSLNGGLRVTDATILTTGIGNISLTGTGSDNGIEEGVSLSGATISSTSTGPNAGAISIHGISGDAGEGVILSQTSAGPTSIASVDGDILIRGEKGESATPGGAGVLLGSNTQIVSTGDGADAAAITIDGSGGLYGVRESNSQLSSVNGAITINGVASSELADDVRLQGAGIWLTGANIASTGSGTNAATISITGKGGNAFGNDEGVDILNATITSVDGDISISGEGGDPGSDGIHMGKIQISSTGTGENAAKIIVEGTGRTAIRTAFDASTNVLTSVDGDILVRGEGAAGTTIGVEISDRNVISSTGVGPDAATITIEGTAPNGGGVLLQGLNSTISSIDGDILLTGAGLSGGTVGVSVESTGVGAAGAKVTIEGTGTSSDGLNLIGDVVSVAGAVQLTAAGGAGGTGLRTSGSGTIGGAAASGPITIHADSINFSSASRIQSSGALTIQPAAGTSIGLGGGDGQLNLNDFELGVFEDGFASITIGDLTSGSGAVELDTVAFSDPVTIAGGVITDRTGTDITAGTNSVTLRGTVAPGQSPGILAITGSLAFADNDTFHVEIGGATPGDTAASHDQIDVTGTVTIGADVTLDTSSFNGFSPADQHQYVILNNDGNDAVQGTFAGLPEGALITNFLGSNLSARISYRGIDSATGNDVVLTAISNTPPVAVDDVVATDEDSSVVIDVLADNGNGADSDLENNIDAALTVNLTSPSAGVLTNNNDGTFSFEPHGDFESLAAGESVVETFIYQIEDTGGQNDTATVTITINGVNDQPIITVNSAAGDAATGLVTEGDAGNLTANGTLSVMDLDTSDVVTATVDDVFLTTGNANGISNQTLKSMLRANTFPWTAGGDAAHDWFGFSVSGAGDVDGDGTPDVIVGAPMADDHGSNSGIARILSGRDGNTLFTFSGDSAGDQFGFSVSGAGDVNGDGFSDVIVGAWADDNSGIDSGSATVFSGRNGSILWSFDGDAADDQFGYSVSGAGDVNLDGFDDLIVGARFDDDHGSSSGSARVFSGRDGTTLFEFHGDSAFDGFGRSVSGAGDVDGDGFDDVIIGAYGDDNSGANSGSARVFSGQDGSVLFTFNGDSAFDTFGIAVSGAGDVNGDGFDDLVVGAVGDDNQGTTSGSARVFSGQDGSVLFTFDGESPSDTFGVSVSDAGDVDGDGFGDVIVGAFRDDNSGSNSGSARVFSGQDGSVLFTFNGRSAGDEFGRSVSGVGDLDGDGLDDLVVGARFDDDNGSDSGSARVFTGGDTTSKITWAFDSGDETFDHLAAGESLALTYTVRATDSSGSSIEPDSDIQAVVITINGSNDQPDIIVDTSSGDTAAGSVNETDEPNLTVGGTLSMSDLDITDALSTSVDTVVVSGGNANTLDQLTLQDMLRVTTSPLLVNGEEGDFLGRSVSDAGDVNGDGFDDVIVGASRANDSQTPGSAGVFSGLDGSLLFNFDGEAGNDRFGESASGAGDVNGDGFDDLIVGAKYDRQAGTARVFSGADGSVLFTFEGDQPGDSFGVSVDGAGDVNGDGFDDLVVGARGDGNSVAAVGLARVFSGQDGSELFTVSGVSAQGRFGESLSGAGDVNGDGFDDVIVGAYREDNHGADSGSAQVFSGVDGSLLYTFDGDSAGDNFGTSVSGAGDVNGDGFDDLIVGARFDDNNGPSSGSARVFSGQDGAVLFTFDGDSITDNFGASVSGAGDVNGDGFDDLVIGAFGDDNRGSASGSARVFSGQDGSVLFTLNGNSANDQFGFSVSGAGDVNGDGLDDIIVGAFSDDKNGAFSGSARVFTGGNTTGRIAWLFDSGEETFDYLAAGESLELTYSIGVTDDSGGGAEPDRDTQAVVVTVNGTNDQPSFDEQSYSFSLPENSHTDTSVGGVTASDSDVSDTDLTFAIIDGNTDGAFAIDSATGEIRVANQTAIDFETNPSFSLTVEVDDNNALPNSSSTVGVTVDLTDLEATLSIADASSLEQTDWFSFGITLSGDRINTLVSVNVDTEDGSATDNGAGVGDNDYNGVSGLINFSGALPSETRYLLVRVNDDQVVEQDENFFVNLSTTSNDVSFTDAQGEGTIINDDGVMLSVDNSSVLADEGQIAENSGTVSEAQDVSIALTASIGQVVNHGDGTWTWSQDTLDGPDQSQLVTITADDGATTTTVEFDLVVNNVAPAPSIDTISDLRVRGLPIDVAASATDPAGTHDTLTFSYEVFKDGEATAVASASGVELTSFNFTPDEVGSFEIVLTVNDEDGDSNITTSFITVLDPFVVTSTLDSIDPTDGVITLREAITHANAIPGTDTISFNIPGEVVHTIQVQSTLPDIAEPAIIDGTTQSGAAPNSLAVGNNAELRIELDGSLAGDVSGLTIVRDGGGSTIRGLVINRFQRNGIAILSSNGNLVEGNFVGVSPDGSSSLGNSSGISIAGSDNQIGEADAASRNVISGNGSAGVVLFGSTTSGNRLTNNYIGVDATGTAAVPNQEGVRLFAQAAQNIVGGPTSASRNIISGNSADGIAIDSGAHSNQILGNYVGTDALGTSPLGNSRGVKISDATNNMVGGTTAGLGNIISMNRGVGVLIAFASENQIVGNSLTDNLSQGIAVDGNKNQIIGNVVTGSGIQGIRIATGTGNRVSENSIAGNAGLGIDLGSPGVQTNDPGDADTGANNLQNFPVIASAFNGGGTTTLSGSLHATPNQTFAVEFFSSVIADPSGFGEGETYLGTTTVSTDASGNASLLTSLPVVVPDGHFVTATATDSAGNTSEFSVAVAVVDAVVSARFVSHGNETAAVAGQFSISQNAASLTDTVIAYDVGGAATAGVDYQQLSGIVTIPAGQTSAAIFVPVIDDQEIETNELVEITLDTILSASPGISLDTQRLSASLGIIDNDPDDDVDGVSDGVEAGVPSLSGVPGDGNGDGIADGSQERVASLPNSSDGSYVTIVSPVDTLLGDVTAIANPSPDDTPEGVEFPVGFLNYEVQGVIPGGAVTVTILAAPGTQFTSFYKYGPEPGSPTPHWYDFAFDPLTNTGAVINGNEITLHFVDGQRGDDDLTANGIIVDPGAPGGPAAEEGELRARPGGPYIAQENTAFFLDGSQTVDPGRVFTYAWDTDYDGTTFDVDHTGVRPAITIPDDVNSRRIALRVTNSSGESHIATTRLEVANVVPNGVLITNVGDAEGVFPIGPISLEGSFQDLGILDTHSAVWTLTHAVDDAVVETTRVGAVSETNGSGTVADTEAGPVDFSDPDLGPGVYTVTLTVTDDDGGVRASVSEIFVVYDPNAGFVTGGGWIHSPAGAFRADPSLTGKANFGFVSKYKKGASVPTGQTEFQFKAGDLDFHSSDYQWLVVAGARAQYKGTGMIGGQAGYRFLLTATDADVNSSDAIEEDRFRIKIWATNPVDADDESGVVYDNNLADASNNADPETLISGNIVIHNDGKNLLASHPAGMVGDAKLLTQGDLDLAVDDAISHWANQGIHDELLQTLHSIDVRPADLSGHVLGKSSSSTNLVWIDRDAAGVGWTTGNSRGYDLLAAVTHELGHVLGLDHSHDETDVMASTLRLPAMRLVTGPHSLATALDLLTDSASTWGDVRLLRSDARSWLLGRTGHTNVTLIDEGGLRAISYAEWVALGDHRHPNRLETLFNESDERDQELDLVGDFDVKLLDETLVQLLADEQTGR